MITKLLKFKLWDNTSEQNCCFPLANLVSCQTGIVCDIYLKLWNQWKRIPKGTIDCLKWKSNEKFFLFKCWVIQLKSVTLLKRFQWYLSTLLTITEKLPDLIAKPWITCLVQISSCWVRMERCNSKTSITLPQGDQPQCFRSSSRNLKMDCILALVSIYRIYR